MGSSFGKNLNKTQRTYLGVGGVIGTIGVLLGLASLVRVMNDKNAALGIAIISFILLVCGFVTVIIGLSKGKNKPQNMFNVTTTIYFCLGALLAFTGMITRGKVSNQGPVAKSREVMVADMGLVVMSFAFIGTIVAALKPDMDKALIDLNFVMVSLGFGLILYGQIRQRVNKGYRVSGVNLDICLEKTLLESTLDYTITGALLITLAAITSGLTKYGIK